MRRGLGLVLLLSGCLAHERRGVPLYTTQGAALPLASVAKLSGPVIAVDGREVNAKGGVFELMPGCHVVVTGGRTGRFDQLYGGYVASMPKLTYAFRMRAGHSYSVELVPDRRTLGTLSYAQARVVAHDEDAHGSSVAVTEAHDAASITACLAWSPER